MPWSYRVCLKKQNNNNKKKADAQFILLHGKWKLAGPHGGRQIDAVFLYQTQTTEKEALRAVELLFLWKLSCVARLLNPARHFGKVMRQE